MMILSTFNHISNEKFLFYHSDFDNHHKIIIKYFHFLLCLSEKRSSEIDLMEGPCEISKEK